MGLLARSALMARLVQYDCKRGANRRRSTKASSKNGKLVPRGPAGYRRQSFRNVARELNFDNQRPAEGAPDTTVNAPSARHVFRRFDYPMKNKPYAHSGDEEPNDTVPVGVSSLRNVCAREPGQVVVINISHLAEGASRAQTIRRRSLQPFEDLMTRTSFRNVQAFRGATPLDPIP